MNSLFSPSKGCDLFDQSREPGEFYIARFVRSVVNFSTSSNFYYLYAGTGRETDHQVSRDEGRRREGRTRLLLIRVALAPRESPSGVN